jgi:hypothetical protein
MNSVKLNAVGRLGKSGLTGCVEFQIVDQTGLAQARGAQDDQSRIRGVHWLQCVGSAHLNVVDNPAELGQILACLLADGGIIMIASLDSLLNQLQGGMQALCLLPLRRAEVAIA